MASLREFQDEHREVIRWLEAMKEEMGTLLVGQVLEGSEAIARMPSLIQVAVLPHFRLEEAIIFPMLAKGSPAEAALREELLADHLSLKECFFCYLMEVGKGVVSDGLVKLAQDMGDHLAAHAKKEDTFLIPIIRKRFQIGEDDPLPGHAPPTVFWDGQAGGESQPTPGA